MTQGKLRLDDVLFAANACRGNISRAADRLGVRRYSLYRYLHRTPQAAEAFAEWRQRLIDMAEEQLWTCVEQGQPWAVSLVLCRLGASRGYVTPSEVRYIAQETAPLTIQLRWDEVTPDPEARPARDPVEDPDEAAAEAELQDLIVLAKRRLGR